MYFGQTYAIRVTLLFLKLSLFFLQRDRRYIVFCCHANMAAVVGDSDGSCLDFNN